MKRVLIRELLIRMRALIRIFTVIIYICGRYRMASAIMDGHYGIKKIVRMRIISKKVSDGLRFKNLLPLYHLLYFRDFFERWRSQREKKRD